MHPKTGCYNYLCFLKGDDSHEQLFLTKTLPANHPGFFAIDMLWLGFGTKFFTKTTSLNNSTLVALTTDIPPFRYH